MTIQDSPTFQEVKNDKSRGYKVLIDHIWVTFI